MALQTHKGEGLEGWGCWARGHSLTGLRLQGLAQFHHSPALCLKPVTPRFSIWLRGLLARGSSSPSSLAIIAGTSCALRSRGHSPEEPVGGVGWNPVRLGWGEEKYFQQGRTLSGYSPGASVV